MNKFRVWGVGYLNLKVPPLRIPVEYKGRKRVTLQWGGLVDTTLTKWSEWSPAVGQIEVLSLDIGYSENTSSFWWYSGQGAWPESNHEETTDKPILRDILQVKWPAINFKSFKVVKVKARLRNYFKLKETEETAKCHMWFWPGAFCYQDHCWNLWNLNGAWGLNGSNVSVLMLWFW